MEEQLKVTHAHRLVSLLLIKAKLWQTLRDMINSQMVTVQSVCGALPASCSVYGGFS